MIEVTWEPLSVYDTGPRRPSLHQTNSALRGNTGKATEHAEKDMPMYDRGGRKIANKILEIAHLSKYRSHEARGPIHGKTYAQRCEHLKMLDKTGDV